MPNGLPPIYGNQPIVDPKTGRGTPAFILLINQLISKIVNSTSAALATLLAKTIDSSTLTVTGTYGDQIDINLEELSPDPAGTYGDATHYPTLVVDKYGRVTAADEEAAAGAIEVTDGTTAVTGVSKVVFTGATVAAGGAGEALVAISGGGGGGDYSLITSVAANLGDSSWTISSIPQTFKDLILVGVFGLSGNNNQININFNHDTGNNYDTNFESHFEFTTSNNTSKGLMSLWSGVVNVGSQTEEAEITIYDYSNALNNKRYQGTGTLQGGGNFCTRRIIGNWHPATAAAITDIEISASGGATITTAGEFRLYGRKS